MTYATEGSEGRVGSQVNLSDALGFSLMGGIGGATVAVADRTTWTIGSAIGTNFAIAGGLALFGVLISRRIRPAAA
jgi:hypothetical protein